jgi:hypothetical protein
MPILTIYKTKLTSIYGILLYSMFFFIFYFFFDFIDFFLYIQCVAQCLHSNYYLHNQKDKDNIIFQSDWYG